MSVRVDNVGLAHPELPWCVEPDTTVGLVLKGLAERPGGVALICGNGRLSGIFTERDALALVAAPGDLDRPIADLMTRDPATVTSNATVADAIRVMSGGRYRQVPLVDAGGVPTGVVGTRGVLRYLVEHFPNVVYTLPPRPHHNTQEREGA